jgi:Ran GTPase-activating protein (RanGAP) involved in mRNA processing and transport
MTMHHECLVAAWTNLPLSSHYLSICKTMVLEPNQQMIQKMNSQVPYVDLSFPSFGLNDHQFIALLQCLQEEGSLCTIDVTGNDLSDCSLLVLSRIISHFEYLWSVQIGRNTFGPFGAKALLKSMSSLSHLRVVDLSYTHLTDACSAELSAVIKSSQTSVEELYFDHCFLGNEGIVDICAACQECHALKALDLGFNDSVHLDDAVPSWAMCLDDDRCGLKEFHLSGNRFGLQAVQSICKMKNFLQRFSTLDFERCYVGDAGVSRLIQHLCDLGHLSSDHDAEHNNVAMNLSHCRIGKLGSAEIAFLISRGYPLKSLDLSHNIVAESAELLAHSSLQNHWLIDLDLSSCQLSPHHCRVFITTFGKGAPTGISSSRSRTLRLANNIPASSTSEHVDDCGVLDDEDGRRRGMDVEDLLDVPIDEHLQWKECLLEAVCLMSLDLSGNAIDEEILSDLEKVWVDELLAGFRVGTGTIYILQGMPS